MWTSYTFTVLCRFEQNIMWQVCNGRPLIYGRNPDVREHSIYDIKNIYIQKIKKKYRYHKKYPLLMKLHYLFMILIKQHWKFKLTIEKSHWCKYFIENKKTVLFRKTNFTIHEYYYLRITILFYLQTHKKLFTYYIYCFTQGTLREILWGWNVTPLSKFDFQIASYFNISSIDEVLA